MFWEIVLLFPLLYTATLMPYYLLVADAETSNTRTISVIEFIVTVAFTVDMLVSMNTAFYSRKRRGFVVNRAAICMRYTRTWFFIDLVSVLPLELFMGECDESPLLLVVQGVHWCYVYPLPLPHRRWRNKSKQPLCEAQQAATCNPSDSSC